jgi:hypothetical protein
MWLLAGSPTAKTLQEINLVSGKIGLIVPVGADADSLVESSTGVLAVGYSSASGPIEFRNSASGALLHSVTVGTPVKDLSAGADGNTFYALVGTPTETSVATVSSSGATEPATFGVALDTVSLAVSSAEDQLYLLESSGTVVDTPLNTTSGPPVASASFFVGQRPVQFALSPDGSTVFVLKGAGATMNVSVFNAATERQLRVLPAPAHGVAVVTSIDGAQFYVLVGTPTIGNIQVYPVAQ